MNVHRFFLLISLKTIDELGVFFHLRLGHLIWPREGGLGQKKISALHPTILAVKYKQYIGLS